MQLELQLWLLIHAQQACLPPLPRAPLCLQQRRKSMRLALPSSLPPTGLPHWQPCSKELQRVKASVVLLQAFPGERNIEVSVLEQRIVKVCLPLVAFP